MARARKGAARTQARRKLLREARGFYGTKSRHKQQAKVAMMRAKRHAWRDRRARKRDFRALWITRINAGARNFEMSYSRLMAGLKAAGLEIDRKSLADLAVHDLEAFGAIVQKAKASLEPR